MKKTKTEVYDTWGCLMAVLLILIPFALLFFFHLNTRYTILQHLHILGNRYLHFVDYSLPWVRLQLSSPITCVHHRFSAWGSEPPIIGIHGVLANQKKSLLSPQKKLIILHVRIDPKNKVRNSRRVRAHQSHENWNISLFRLE